ncbi:MAG: CYTH domain-containing protein [Kiritimatiellae bacterium]|nr:CYTH domain-containing protein [Kiritimatiellia bacterium]MDW8458397.1 CYTH domain-containing protein [Verrucomicrobiota bacterium]
MKQEIERKFLVRSPSWRAAAISAVRILQGYLCGDPDRTVRVRMAGASAWITIKGRSHGAARAEFEYPIPVEEARFLLEHICLPGRIEKTRHVVPCGGLLFEVDEFHGENVGLILAEVELPATETEIERPEWLGEEVTGDERFYNAYLARHPYSTWK